MVTVLRKTEVGDRVGCGVGVVSVVTGLWLPSFRPPHTSLSLCDGVLLSIPLSQPKHSVHMAGLADNRHHSSGQSSCTEGRIGVEQRTKLEASPACQDHRGGPYLQAASLLYQPHQQDLLLFLWFLVPGQYYHPFFFKNPQGTTKKCCHFII